MIRALFYGALAGLILACSALFPHAHAAVNNRPIVNVCMALRSGTTLVDLERDLEARGYTPRDAGVFAGESIREHCPGLIPNVMGMLA